MGRKSQAAPLLAPIQASEQARERAKAVLLTLSGQWSVKQALVRLSISRTRFQDLRRRMLCGALEALEPRPLGRPSNPVAEEDEQLVRLRQKVEALGHELRLVRTSLELSESPAAEAVRRRVRHVLETKRRRR